MKSERRYFSLSNHFNTVSKSYLDQIVSFVTFVVYFLSVIKKRVGRIFIFTPSAFFFLFSFILFEEKRRNEIFLLFTFDNHRTAIDFIESTNSNHLLDIVISNDDKRLQNESLRNIDESFFFLFESGKSFLSSLMNILDCVA